MLIKLNDKILDVGYISNIRNSDYININSVCDLDRIETYCPYNVLITKSNPSHDNQLFRIKLSLHRSLNAGAKKGAMLND